MKRIVYIFLIFIVSCATMVGSKQDLLSIDELQIKECYSYDTRKRNTSRNMGSSAALGLVGGLFPILLPVTLSAAIVVSAADQSSLPIKCGLTVDDAIKEAYILSYFEDSVAVLIQKREEGIKVFSTPELKLDKGCSIHKIEIVKGIKKQNKYSGEDTMVYEKHVYNIELCKDENGAPIITRDTISEQEIKKIKELKVEKEVKVERVEIMAPKNRR